MRKGHLITKEFLNFELGAAWTTMYQDNTCNRTVGGLMTSLTPHLAARIDRSSNWKLVPTIRHLCNASWLKMVCQINVGEEVICCATMQRPSPVWAGPQDRRRVQINRNAWRVVTSGTPASLPSHRTIARSLIECMVEGYLVRGSSACLQWASVKSSESSKFSLLCGFETAHVDLGHCRF